MPGIKIPKEFQQSVRLQNTENVVLLNLSTLNSKPAIYKYVKDSYVFNGLVQLEPGTKYFLAKLSSEGKKIDRIVILETPETRKKLKETPGTYSEEWDQEKSAVDVYKERICAYIRCEEPYRAGKKDAVENESQISAKVQYDETDLSGLFRDIELQADQSVFFPEVMREVCSKDPEHKVDLYIDMQGGDRGITVANINALVQLLKDQNVTVKERIRIRFQITADCQPIEDVGSQFRGYDLITAMNSFKKYGRGKELVDYFREDESSAVRNLVDAIQDASDAIALCDVSGFDKAIEHIEKLKGRIEPAGKSEMDIVASDIYDDYSPLFGVKYRYVEQIRWCLRKNYIQQALTILEAKMPAEYVRSGLKYYCDSTEEEAGLLEKATEACHDAQKGRYQFKDIDHYFIRSQGNYDYPYIFNEKYGIPDQDAVDRSIAEYKKLCDRRNSANHANDERNGKFLRRYKEKYPEDRSFENGNLTNIEAEINGYLNRFVQLADKVPAEVRKKVIDFG